MLVLSTMYAIADSVPSSLACHPHTPFQAIRKIEVVVEEVTSGGLMLTFSLVGDISSLSIPESQAPRRADHLWRHTCIEVFMMAGEGPGYLEFNFSPSGEWAVYDFRGYRDRGELEIELTPGIVVRRNMDRLELCAEICGNFIPRGGPLRVGLSAVVEDTAGVLSYWALRHPPGSPDFHHTDSFALQLLRT
jgi:hypothetical protein